MLILETTQKTIAKRMIYTNDKGGDVIFFNGNMIFLETMLKNNQFIME